MLKLFDIFRRNRLFDADSPEKAAFQNKYRHFQDLLGGNNRALEIMTDLEQTCYGAKPFSLSYIIGQAEKLISQVYDISEDLNALSGGRYAELFDAVERIGIRILQELVQKRTIEKTSYTLPLQHLSLERVSEVGGKAANLGEVFNRVHLPVPRGFAVTAYACHHFMEANDLYATAERILKGLDIEDTERLVACSREIQALVLEAPLPAGLESGLLREVDALVREFGPEIRLAVRSSATSEDSEASFAGQHSSVLGVHRGNIVQAYKEVVASTFNPRAIYYRSSKGYPDEFVIMSVLCVVMVDAKASGVMYTRDPNDHRRDVMMINAVWGLGVGAVDGSAETDFYEVERPHREVLTVRVAEKRTQTVLGPEGKLFDEPVPASRQSERCLRPEQLSRLIDYGLTLEEHYGVPLDVEWTLDRHDHLVFLQARPLNLDLSGLQAASGHLAVEALPGHPVLLKGGATASRGKASGLAYVLTSEHNLLRIPEGAILIAPQTSPRYVSVLGRVQAIVTDIGSVTGHMASVAREFGVPTLVGTGNATTLIAHGEEITVDATNAVVFRGRVESILERRKAVNPMKGSPAYKAAHTALKKIAILNLIDPESPNFSPEGCQTLHDLIRFAHEKSMREMFRISDDLEVSERFAVRLKAPLPMKIYAVDLGGGLRTEPGTAEAGVEAVSSVPFRALLQGMLNPNVHWVGGVGMDWRGFGAVMAESLMHDPHADERLGEPSYVAIADDYFNFNSRLGYHFAVLDAYCGPEVNHNHVLFSFKGGAADIGRRSRRALLIAKILKRLGFKTQLKGDWVRGEVKKLDALMIQDKLDLLGRLLGAMRLLDMVLSDDGSIDWYVEQFFQGNYTFERR